MNMLGDLRYVSAEEFASYSDANSQKKQDAAYLAYKELLKQEAGTLGKQLPAVGNESDEKWKAQHPPGFVEHREAFSRNGKYGKWLRKLEAIKVIDGIVFLHGGISPSIKDLTPSEINRRIHKELELFDACHESLLNKKLILQVSTIDEILIAARDELALMEQKNQKQNVSLKECLELNRWLIRHPDGPLWFRGFDTWSGDADGAANISSILETFRASHFITGHSVQAGGQIRTRFGGKLFLIDTGMLSSQYAGGRASALEYRNGKFTAIYPDGRKEFDQ